MCGLVGFISKNKNEEILRDMLKIQDYRGPDDRGIFFDEKSGVHLGHNRLAIIDLSPKGHQPFISSCSNYVIVFNGEIFNFASIRDELMKLGESFLSNTDTEVALYAYKHWGVKCVEKFIGMFAFVVFDKKKNELILMRDRAGVKPLYYYYDGMNFMFSSEIKSFHKHPNFKKEQNLDALAYYFSFGYILAPFTIFKNCFKLPAGCYLKFNLNDFDYKITKYWNVSDFYSMPKFNKNEKEILDELEIILNDAVNLCMVSDVPVGVFLSGGYDSSLVAALLSKKQKINTFTIGFGDSKINEAEHAKQIAIYLGTNHTEYYMRGSDVLDLIEQLPFFCDEPFGDSSIFATMVLSRITRKSVTVALSADGGDEVFCGYSKYFFLNKIKDIFTNPFKKNLAKLGLNIFGESGANFINEMLPRNRYQTNLKDKFLKLKYAINSKNLDESFFNASSYVNQQEVAKFFKPPLKEKFLMSWKNEHKLCFLDYMMMKDYELFMCDDVLTKVDRATMSVGLEGREPLLDHRLIEYLARVPIDIKYKNNCGKYLLRQILYKYIPKKLVDKPKAGFQIPLAEWLRGELKWLVNMYLDSSKIDGSLFNKNAVNEIKCRFFAGEELQSAVWFILSYQMWRGRWFD